MHMHIQTQEDMHQCEQTDGMKEISPYGHERLVSFITMALTVCMSLSTQDVVLTHGEHSAMSVWRG